MQAIKSVFKRKKLSVSSAVRGQPYEPDTPMPCSGGRPRQSWTHSTACFGRQPVAAAPQQPQQAGEQAETLTEQQAVDQAGTELKKMFLKALKEAVGLSVFTAWVNKSSMSVITGDRMVQMVEHHVSSCAALGEYLQPLTDMKGDIGSKRKWFYWVLLQMFLLVPPEQQLRGTSCIMPSLVQRNPDLWGAVLAKAVELFNLGPGERPSAAQLVVALVFYAADKAKPQLRGSATLTGQ